MKRPADWKEEDLNTLIQTGAEEGTQLEFKAAGSLKKTERDKTEISKDVSSFANSAGGVIVYGMDEDPSSPHKATTISPVDPLQFPKEWLDQSDVSLNRVFEDECGSLLLVLTRTQPSGVSYVVIIPQSFTAHQAYDKCYYKRFNFQSVAMDDYEIRQTMNRSQKPTYEVEIRTTTMPPNQEKIEISFIARIQNCSELVGHEVSAVLLVPRDLAVNQSTSSGIEDIEGVTYKRLPSPSPITAYPFNPQDIQFYGPANWIGFHTLEAQTFDAIVRVYDQHGLAAEEIATISLDAKPGTIIERRVRRREELY